MPGPRYEVLYRRCNVSSFSTASLDIPEAQGVVCLTPIYYLLDIPPQSELCSAKRKLLVKSAYHRRPSTSSHRP